MKILFNTTFYNTKNNYTAKNSNTNFKMANIQKVPKNVLEDLIEQGLSAPKIAKTLGINVSHIILNLKEYGLETKPRQAYYKLRDNVEELLRKGLSTTEIGKMYGMNRRDVYEVAVNVVGKEAFHEIKRMFVNKTVPTKRENKDNARVITKYMVTIKRLRSYLEQLQNQKVAIEDEFEGRPVLPQSVTQMREMIRRYRQKMQELLADCIVETFGQGKMLSMISRASGLSDKVVRSHASKIDKEEAIELFKIKQKERELQKEREKQKTLDEMQKRLDEIFARKVQEKVYVNKELDSAKITSELKQILAQGFSDKKIEDEIGYSMATIAQTIGIETFEKMMQERDEIQAKLIYKRMMSGIPNDLIAKSLGLSQAEFDSIVKTNRSHIDDLID